jgi:GrpB-like predicted nucleotidyltransferase (UPF0157 family)
MHYDPRWRQEFQQTRSSVLQSCLGWVTEVQHIGSTAVSGLVARPTLDVLAGVQRDQPNDEDPVAQAANLIEGLNYRQVDPPAWSGNAVVLDKPRHGEPTHRIFLMTIGCGPWQQAIGIREVLRAQPELAIRFEETKIARWRAGEGDPDRYEADKAIFFTHLLDQIESS